MFQTAVFDMDGTLVDTMQATWHAFCTLAPRFDLPTPPRQTIQAFIGLSDAYFYPALYPDADASRLRALSDAITEEENRITRTLGPAILFPGVDGMLRTLSERGVTLLLASTGSPSHVHTALEATGIRDLFRKVSCGAPDKEEMTRDLLRLAEPGNAVFIGDSQKDIAAARHCGIPIFGAGFGYVKPAEHVCFDKVLRTPQELFDAIMQ